MGILVGAHVDREDPIEGARARSADIAQFFLGDPQDWRPPKLDYPGGPEGLKADAATAGIGLYVHAPYVINVATSNNRIRIPSRKILQQAIDGAADVGALGVIVHGGHVLAKDDPEGGFDNWRKCVERLEIRCPVFIENTAGGTKAMARHLDDIARLWEAVKASDGDDAIGFCLDTCHAHAGGEELSTIVDRLKSITGQISLVHANDSRDAFGSGRDRHANLGQGQIDGDDLLAVVRGAGAPVIVETPGGVEGQGADIRWLRDRLG